MAPHVETSGEAHVYSLQEIALLQKALKKAQPEPGLMKFVIIDNKIYDVTDFIAGHPGGEAVISTHIGKDATDIFHAMHPESAYEVLANNYVGDLEVHEPEKKEENFEHAMRELGDFLRKEGFFKSNKMYYAQMVALNMFILAVSIITLYYYGHTTAGVLISATALGIFWQQSGWLSHDFAHHQVFEDRWLNNIVVMFLGNFCLGFSLSWWKDKHNTHHAATNIHDFDPDIMTSPTLMWSEYSSADFYEDFAPENDMLSRFLAKHVHTRQSWYYYPILSLSRLSWAHQSLIFSFGKGSLDKSATTAFIERLVLITHWVLYTYVTFSLIPNGLNQLLFFMASQMVCGYSLALVFVLNHNGMPIITEEQAMEMGFFKVQVVTGRDVYPNIFTNWFMGALNFQIEHHCFPTIPRHNLPGVQTLVQSLCKKHNIPYHMTSVYQGTKEVWNILTTVEQVSQRLSKKGF